MKFLSSFLILASLSVKSINGKVKYFDRCINKGDFAITFDDGPSLDYTAKILDILDEENVKATFFVNGVNTCDILNNSKARALIEREYNSGHVIGSHTYSHPFGITTLSDEQLTNELTKLNNAIYDIVGVKPAFFRPPLGEYSEANLEIIEKCGITANILWNLDSEDWNVEYNATQQYIDNLEGKESQTHSWISLNHDIQKVTAETNLRIVIPYIRKLGYNFVTMDVCTGLPAYQSEDSKEEQKQTITTTKLRTTTKSKIVKTTTTTITTTTVAAAIPTNNSENNNNNNNENINIEDESENKQPIIENQQNLNANTNSNDANTLNASIMISTFIMAFISYLLL